MSQGRFRSFLTGALVGAGLGILLAPREGSETRNDLKKSFSLLIDTIRDVDVEETKAKWMHQVADIKSELANIDEATAKQIAVEKMKVVEDKCNDLMESARKEGSQIVEKAAKEVKENAVNVLHEFLDELETKETEVVKKENEKKAPKKTTRKKTTSKTKKVTKGAEWK